MRQTRWNDNTPITLFVLPNHHTLHKEFTQKTLKILPYKLERIWNKLTFSGLGVAPIVVDTPQALIEAVKKTPGALGYVEDISQEELVNVVKISQ